MDFGLARDPDADPNGTGARQRLTEKGIALGTLQYISPEQCRGKPGLASDVYALGILLYLMLEGRFPFDDQLTTPEELVSWHLHGVPREMIACQSPLLKDLIARMLAKESRKRPQLSEIQDALYGIGGNVLRSTVRVPTVEPLPCENETTRMALPVQTVPVEAVVDLILPADAMTIRAASPRFAEPASPMEVIDDDTYMSRSAAVHPSRSRAIAGEISIPASTVIVDRRSSGRWHLGGLFRRVAQMLFSK
jgi:serine/threonine protein kinase